MAQAQVLREISLPPAARTAALLASARQPSSRSALCWGPGLHAALHRAALPFFLLVSATRWLRLRLRRSRYAKRWARRQSERVDRDLTGRSPRNLYELLGVDPEADMKSIRKAYLDKLKLFHPDIVGPEGEEVAVLLNKTYALFSNPIDRFAYLEASMQETLHSTDVKVTPPSTDLDPVWQRAQREKRGEAPVWGGRPRSRSLWDRVDEQHRGDRWDEQQFVFVDEFRCISCWNCVACAPKTFCIDAEYQRARVFAQWGDSEEDLDWAKISCPVDCISWVSRDELQVLEFVTAKQLHTTGYLYSRRNPTARQLAFEWRQEREQAEKKARTTTGQRFSDGSRFSELQQELDTVLSHLSLELLRTGGWR